MADEWDPFAPNTPVAEPLPTRRQPIHLIDSTGEDTAKRQLRMLRQASLTCSACTMCNLGMQYAKVSYDHAERDPHVFSNMNPSPFVVVGQGPGWEELKAGEPFVGQAGQNFNRELAKHGVDRSEFYITNALKCWSSQNAPPTETQRKRCEPFLAIELGLLKPLLVVALGAVALEALCPGVPLRDALGKITYSSKYEDVPVFAVYHPSPLNLDEGGRRPEFERQMGLLCGVVQNLRGRGVG